ncbi:50S ribosomal protein L1 [Candidatus Uhrbacteria bacterium]|nr:50S ribosomal protein L1 [Candidatus Uhrbacteria bacterium]
MKRKESPKFIAGIKGADLKKQYSPEEAISLVQKASSEKFDASIEVHINTGIDPKKGDQIIRGSVVLPHGVGKTKKIAVFAEGEKADEAKSAGADIVGGAELIAEIKSTGKADFDVAIATPDMMRHLAAAAKVLGPKGLMPSPKNETVTANLKAAIEQVKKGKINFKNDDSANVHQTIGKRSFEHAKLLENYSAFTDAIKKSRPSAAKGVFLKSITVKSTMGPGVKVITA